MRANDLVLTVLLSITLASVRGLAEKTNYDTTGLRDPLSKTRDMPVTEPAQETEQTNNNRVAEIETVIETCRIEGIAISGDKRFVVINDQVLAEGDRIDSERDIRIGRIEETKIVFILGTSEMDYYFTPEHNGETP